MPNPINPSALMQFSGIGTQLYGKINIYEMPDTGNLHIDFVANLNTIQVPVSLISGGTWYLVNNDSTLVLDNDSVSYAFKMIEHRSFHAHEPLEAEQSENNSFLGFNDCFFLSSYY